MLLWLPPCIVIITTKITILDNLFLLVKASTNVPITLNPGGVHIKGWGNHGGFNGERQVKYFFIAGVVIAFFSAGGSISREFGPIAVELSTVWWTTAWRFRWMKICHCEVKPEAMENIKLGMRKVALIANPNCSIIVCLITATLFTNSRNKPRNFRQRPKCFLDQKLEVHIQKNVQGSHNNQCAKKFGTSTYKTFDIPGI